MLFELRVSRHAQQASFATYSRYFVRNIENCVGFRLAAINGNFAIQIRNQQAVARPGKRFYRLLQRVVWNSGCNGEGVVRRRWCCDVGMGPTRGVALRIQRARVSKSCANRCEPSLRHGQLNIADLASSTPALQRAVRPRSTSVVLTGGNCLQDRGWNVGLLLGVFALAKWLAVHSQHTCVDGASGQGFEWTWLKVRSTIVVLPPASQVAVDGQAATVLGAGRNSGERKLLWRFRSFIGVPSPAHGPVCAQRAGVVPAGVKRGESAFGRFELLVLVVAPACDAVIHSDSAREAIPG